jgi:hypothetical protein
MTRDQLSAPLKLPAEMLDGWELVPLTIAGEHAGTLMVKGMEVHFAIVDTPRASSRGAVREMLGPVFDRYGMLTTRVPHGLRSAEKFVRRLGFKKTWADSDFKYYLLSAMPWEKPKKEATCHP